MAFVAHKDIDEGLDQTPEHKAKLALENLPWGLVWNSGLTGISHTDGISYGLNYGELA